MQPVRVLQVFSRLDRGGAETMIMTFYRNLDKSKIQFDFVVHTNEKCVFDDEVKALGGKIYRMPRYTILNHLQYVRLWKKLLQKHPEYKIIHGHFFTISAVYFSVARKFNLIRIGHSHNNYKGNDIKTLAIRLLTFPVRYYADYYFACSKQAGEWLYGKKFIRNKKLIIQNNSIDSKLFNYNEQSRFKIRKEFKLQDRFVIGNVGRFSFQKNHDFLIDIFASVHKRYRNTALLLVGKGELQNDIKSKVYKLGLTDHVIFTGVRSDIPDILCAMDLFLLPSHYEGFAIVLLEAQAAGLKCITSSEVVPNDVAVTDLLEYFPLRKTADEWATKVLEFRGTNSRISRHDELLKAGYDVFTSVLWLQNFYLGCCEKGKKQFKNEVS